MIFRTSDSVFSAYSFLIVASCNSHGLVMVGIIRSALLSRHMCRDVMRGGECKLMARCKSRASSHGLYPREMNYMIMALDVNAEHSSLVGHTGSGAEY